VIVLHALIQFLAMSAVAMVVFGWRGRQTDDHPICRRCGFDLSGKPSGVAICSECGSDVSKPTSIRVGHREHRGDLLQFTLREGPSRVGSAHGRDLVVGCANGTFDISGSKVRRGELTGESVPQPTSRGIESQNLVDIEAILNELRDGPQEVDLVGDVEVFALWKLDEPPLGRREIRLSGSFTLLPATRPAGR
jgi:hypothetical protein